MDDKTIIENLKKFIGEFKNRTNRNLLISIIIVTAILIGLIVSFFSSKNNIDINIATEDPEEETPTEHIPNIEPDADADDSITTRRYNSAIRNDLVMFLADLTTYKQNNNDRIPRDEDEWHFFYEDYLTNLKNEYSFKNCDFAKGNCPKIDSLTWENNQLEVIVAYHSACRKNMIVESSGSKSISVYTHLKGETNGTYCISN